MRRALKGTWVIAQTTLIEALRNRILLVSVAFAVFLLLVSIAGASSSVGEQDRIIIDIGLAAASGLGSIVAILLLITTFAAEIKNRTAYTLLSRPLPRWAFVFGKYLGVYWAMLIVVTSMFVVTALTLSIYNVKGVPEGFWHALWLCAMEMGIVSAIAVVFSAIASPVLAGIYSVGFVIGGNFSSDLLALAERLKDKDPLIANFFTVVYWILPDVERFSLRTEITNYLEIPLGYVEYGTLYGITYSAFLLSLGMFIFSRRKAI